ncbi:MAG: hydrogenase [Nitrospinae bacterium]|nr:hydrogenase [Nitrospinota bacterium]
MIKELLERLRQGHKTTAFPKESPQMPERFRGAPALSPEKCADGCDACSKACPNGAISLEGGLKVDLGRCIFCPDCSEACASGAIRYTVDFRLAVSKRENLTVGAGGISLAQPIQEELRQIFARSLKLRQVSAGGCNGCEAEIAATGNIIFDLGRFGIQVVASPRHADGLMVTGPGTANMKLALEKTYEATPGPKIVIAVGSCALSGGPFRNLPEQSNGVEGSLPVDLYIPGCPPHPLTILDGLLRLLGRLDD